MDSYLPVVNSTAIVSPGSAEIESANVIRVQPLELLKFILGLINEPSFQSPITIVPVKPLMLFCHTVSL